MIDTQLCKVRAAKGGAAIGVVRSRATIFHGREGSSTIATIAAIVTIATEELPGVPASDGCCIFIILQAHVIVHRA